MMACRLHDISRTPFHQPSIGKFLQQLHEAIVGGFPSGGQLYRSRAHSRVYTGSPYSAVNVLLLSWKDDDLGVADELDRLQHVLENHYRYSVETWSIPSNDSHNSLGDRLREFTKTHAVKDALLIVYYGGHGYLNASRLHIWACNKNADAATVRWYAHQASLEELVCDVLILLDCCTAGGSGGEARHGLKEIIAACGYETWTPGVGDHSFTKSLTDELLQLSQSRPFSASNLHHRVLERLKHWSPMLSPEQLSCVDRHGNLQDTERRKTPVHILLNQGPQFRSICISPLPESTDTEVEASDSAYSSDNSGYPRDSSGGLSAFQDRPGVRTDVLISVQVESSQDWDIERVCASIKDMPLVAKAVRLHSISQGHSFLVVLAIPVTVWDLLPDDPACSFVGFTTSENLLFNTIQPMSEGHRKHLSSGPSADDTIGLPPSCSSTIATAASTGVTKTKFTSSASTDDIENVSKPLKSESMGPGLLVPTHRLGDFSNEDDRKHPEWLRATHDLADADYDRGLYDRAANLYEPILYARQQILGSDHPDTLITLKRLAKIYSGQLRYVEAEELYQRELAGCEERLGAQHPETLRVMDSLADVQYKQVRYDKAAVLYERILCVRDELIGFDHPDTLWSVGCLAKIYNGLHRYAEAEKLYQRQLAGCEERLGAWHPETLEVTNNLAVIQHNQGRYDEAAQLYQQVISARTQIMGPGHFRTLLIVGYLARTYSKQHRYAEAEKLYKQLIAGYERRLGAQHLATLRVVDELIQVYRDQGRYDRADLLWQQKATEKKSVGGLGLRETLVKAENVVARARNRKDVDYQTRVQARVGGEA